MESADSIILRIIESVTPEATVELEYLQLFEEVKLWFHSNLQPLFTDIFMVGSVARKTCRLPLHIDFYFVRSKHAAAQSGRTVSGLVNLIVAKMQGTFQIRVQQHSIGFMYKGCHFDLVPVILNEEGRYSIGDNFLDGWKKAGEPQEAINNLNEADARLREYTPLATFDHPFRMLVRLAKTWKSKWLPELKSFHLEVAIYRAFAKNQLSNPTTLLDIVFHMFLQITYISRESFEPPGGGEFMNSYLFKNGHKEFVELRMLIETTISNASKMLLEAIQDPSRAKEILESLFLSAK